MWVCKLAADEVHAEICRRLRDRWELIREAFMLTMDEAFSSNQTFTFPTFLQFLERLTIDDVVVDWDPEQSIPLLSDSGPRDIRWEHPAEEVVLLSERHPYSVSNLRVHFIGRLMDWLFRPARSADRSLTEYVDLRNEFKKRKRAVKAAVHSRMNWQRSVEQWFSQSEIALLGRAYTVPRRWETYVSATRPPADLARILLTHKWGCDFQAVKELLVELRKEAPIRTAWAGYDRWLSEHPAGIKEIRTIICRSPAVFPWPRSWPTG